MKVGLIDVDAVNRNKHSQGFPNLALMRISAYHKAKGDDVEWWWTGLIHYDIVYMSKVFSDSYSPDIPEPPNVDKVIKGGTGYAISTVGGKNALINQSIITSQTRLNECSQTTVFIRSTISLSA